MKLTQRHRPQAQPQSFGTGDGIDFVRCRICGDHRRVLSARHLSRHGTDRDEYMDEYGLSPDELIAKDFRIIQSSRRGYRPYGRTDWIAAIKKINRQGRSVFAAALQEKCPYLYQQGIWLFDNWNNALRAAGFDPEQTRLRHRPDGEKIVWEIRALRKQKLPLYANYAMKNHSKLFSRARAVSDRGTRQ